MLVRILMLLTMLALSPALLPAQDDEPEKKAEKHVLFIVAGVRDSKEKWIRLDRELRKVDGIQRVDVVPVEDEEFCQARAVYEGKEPSVKTLVEKARAAGYDAMDLETAKKRFAGDPARRIFLDVPEGVKEKEDAINLEVPIRQVKGVKRVIILFGTQELDFGQAIVIVSYDKEKPNLTALIEAASKAGFTATERKTGLPAGKDKK